MLTKPLLGLVLVAVTTGGCAAVNARLGLPDVQRLVAERANASVSWPETAEERAQVGHTVHGILGEELTVESAVRLALLHNRNLQAVYQELGIAQAELVQAGLLPNPVLSANVRFGVGASGTGAELGLVQELISILQIPLKKRVAAANLERAKAEVAGAVLDLVLDVKAAFYGLQAALQMLELRRSVADATGFSRLVAERQHEAGNLSDLELRTEQALHEESKVELAIAEAAVLEDRETLNTLLGLWGGQTAWSIGARLPSLPREDLSGKGLESRAVAQRLDLVVARTQGLSQVAQLRLNRFYGLIPSGSTGVSSEREPDDGIWHLGPSIDVPLPIFDQNQALIASTAARLRASEERVAALAVEIRADVRRVRVRLEAARQRAAYYEAVLLPLESDVVEETQRQYNAMQIGPLQLVQAKRDQIDVGRRYIETLGEYWAARTELERAVGGELALTDGLPAPVETPAVPAPKAGSQHHHGG